MKSPPLAPSDERLATTAWIATAIIAAFLAIGQLGAMVSLALGRAGFAFVAPATLVAALLLGYWLAGQEGLTKGRRWWPVALVLGLLGVAPGEHNVASMKPAKRTRRAIRAIFSTDSAASEWRACRGWLW